MPLLQWSECDFIACLETEPNVEQDQVGHHFEIRRDGLVLCMNLWQYESVIHFSLALESGAKSLIELALFVRERADARQQDGNEWLELRDCVLAGSRFSYIQMGDVYDRRRYPYGPHVRIHVRPQIRIEFVRD